MRAYAHPRLRLVSPLAGLMLLVLWQAADAWLDWSKFVLPAPLEVAGAFRRHFVQLMQNGLVTLTEAVLGFLLGSVIGLAAATVSVLRPAIARVIIPYAVLIKAIPIVVLAPLLVMWLGDGLISKIAMAATAAFFPILVSGVSALHSVEQEWGDLLRLHGASNWQVYWMLRFPHALPEIFSALKVGTSLAMVGAVVGEFTGSSRGIGHLITTSTYYLNIDLVFAAAIVLGLMGITFYGTIGLLERVIVFWRRSH